MIIGSAPSSGGFTPPTYPPPVANFSYDPPDPQSGYTVQFTDLSTNSPTSWLWKQNGFDFSTQQNPPWYGGLPGDYIFSLTATNPYGSNTVTKTVHVDPL